jgi:hypothetical protein
MLKSGGYPRVHPLIGGVRSDWKTSAVVFAIRGPEIGNLVGRCGVDHWIAKKVAQIGKAG